ncbi:MAG: hypothetical protein AAFZ80_08160, partial [Cyanobacteria bacterium P01_A01_bin.105]
MTDGVNHVQDGTYRFPHQKDARKDARKDVTPGRGQGLIFAALDEILLQPEAAPVVLPAIRQVIAAGIPLVWVTHKTLAEVMDFTAGVGQVMPCIVECGSALYWPATEGGLGLPIDPERVGDYWVMAYGGPYVQARAGLRVLANELHHSLLGYGDMTIDRLQKFTGCSAEATQRAKAREFSETFITPKAVTVEALTDAAEGLGFSIQYGERLSHLLSGGVSVAAAMERVRSLYAASDQQVPSAGLGRWPQDKSLLLA